MQNHQNPHHAVDRTTPARRADLDWLRVLAFGLLIFFHAAVVFVPSPIPMVANEVPSLPLQIFVAFLQEFRLGLLFLVSGIGVCFALRRRSDVEFIFERVRRLLVPLVFGIVAVVPPMVYLERLHVGDMPGSFLAFYLSVFTSGPYPVGNLSWHHYWFVAYLFLFCLLGMVFFKQMQKPGFAILAQWLSRGRRLWLLVMPLLLLEIPLRPLFPGFRDLLHDWASFGHWWLLFMFGFAAASHQELLARCRQLRKEALALGLLASGLLFWQFFSTTDAHFSPLHEGVPGVGEYLWFAGLRIVNAWSWLLVCIGYAGCYLNRSGAVLTYLTQAVYPFFCLHLTILVGCAYLIVPLGWSVGAKYLAICGTTLLGTLLTYELVVKRIAWLRLVFGMKP